MFEKKSVRRLEGPRFLERLIMFDKDDTHTSKEDAPASTNLDTNGSQPEAETNREVMPVDQELPPRLSFPVVGIGASAGRT